MEIRDRIVSIMQEHQLSATMFADTLQVQRSNISHILSGRNKPSIDFLEKLCTKFPNIDLKWLITGISSNKNENSPNINQAKTLNPQNNLEKPQTSTKTIVKIITIYNDNTFEILNR